MPRFTGILAVVVVLAVVSGCGGGGDSSVLRATSCVSDCAADGESRCSGVQVQTCRADASGCLAWSAPQACPVGQECDADGACVAPGPGRPVSLTWVPNRERGVNQAGGGYRVAVDGQQALDVPYESGPHAPTTATVRLLPGTHSVTVSAYAALDAGGGTGGTTSSPSLPISVTVP